VSLQVKEFGCAAMSPSGLAVAVGNFNRYFVYAFNSRSGEWEETSSPVIPNLYTVTAVAWRPDGSRVAVGSLCGGCDLYDACVKRLRFKGTFDFTYVSDSQVRLASAPLSSSSSSSSSSLLSSSSSLLLSSSSSLLLSSSSSSLVLLFLLLLLLVLLLLLLLLLSLL
jgi:hypothetical protein